MKTKRNIAYALAAALWAFAAQAEQAAPTRSVTSKALDTPHIQSDVRNLEAIVGKGESTPPSLPRLPPPPPGQTLLVMPSAQPPGPPPGMMPPPREIVNWRDDPMTLIFAAIAFSLVLLALAALYHVTAVTRTARRKLRAYVFVAQAEIGGLGVFSQPVAQLMIRNAGHTPAQDIVLYGNMVFDEFPLKKDLPILVFPDPHWNQQNLGRGHERHKWEYSLLPLTEAQLSQVQAGTHALYIYGEIRYRDVFRKKRYTKYLYYTGGNMGLRDTILGGYPVGNEAV